MSGTSTSRTADADEARAEYALDLNSEPEAAAYDGVVLAVAHQCFREQGTEALRRHGRPGHVLYDLKSVLPTGACELRL